MIDEDSLLGRVLDGRWRVLDRIGAGAMGEVYRAERLKLGKQVAIKVLTKVRSESKDFIDRFEREARVTSRLNHLHCVSILDYGVHNKRPYIVMELVPGIRLTEVIGKIDPVRAVGIVRQILVGLRHAHGQGVLHRDLKPDNIMLAELTGSGDLVKILDFGFAQMVDAESSVTPRTVVAGTPSYMSPEQASGQKVDPRTDLYSVGVILYELATGKKPFYGPDYLAVLRAHIHDPPPPPRETAPNLSPGLEQVILRALQKDRNKRFRDADEFVEGLDGTPEGRKATRGRPGTPARGEPSTHELSSSDIVSEVEPPAAAPPPRKRRWGWAALGLLAAGAAGLAAAAWIQQRTIVPPAADAAAIVVPPPDAAGPIDAAAAVVAIDAQPPPDAQSIDATIPDATVVDADPPPADAEPPPPSVPPARAHIEWLIQARRFGQAEKLLAAADHHEAWVHLDLGHIYFLRIWRSDAIREWDAALRLDPELVHDPNLRHRVCASLDARSAYEAMQLVLSRFGSEARPAMQECLAGNPDPTVQRTAKHILDRIR